MSLSEDGIPDENLEIYKIIYKIEVGLREFIIGVLLARCGSRWWKQRLPSDVLDTYRKGRDYERSIKWSELIPHHPIYYIDFSDLRKVIERADNWRDVFQPVFSDKEVLIGILRGLEPVRNRIAHNRKVTKGDLRIAEAAYAEICSAIGERRFLGLVTKCTLAEDIPQLILRLRQEGELALKACKRCEPLGPLEVWERAQTAWWFDADYLGYEVKAIREYFETLIIYSQLPRSRGTGYRLEEWIESSDMEGKFAKAQQEFSAILASAGGI